MAFSGDSLRAYDGCLGELPEDEREVFDLV